MIDILKENKIKATNQRIKILEMINLNNRVTLKELIEKNDLGMDKSTIYRIINLFLKKNIIKKNIDDSGNIFYEINSNEHVHYIECIECHEKEKIDFCPMDNVKRTGYKLISHQISISGLCEKCQKK